MINFYFFLVLPMSKRVTGWILSGVVGVKFTGSEARWKSIAKVVKP
jgi:hypothetical protein